MHVNNEANIETMLSKSQQIMSANYSYLTKASYIHFRNPNLYLDYYAEFITMLDDVNFESKLRAVLSYQLVRADNYNEPLRNGKIFVKEYIALSSEGVEEMTEGKNEAYNLRKVSEQVF